MGRGFKDELAIVTGAGSGIGRALALALAERGAQVVGTDISDQRLAELSRELEAKGVPHKTYKVDHGDRAAVEEFRDRFFSDFDHVDVMCLNAGVGLGGRLEEMTLDDWEWLMRINLWGAVYMLQLFGPKMIERKKGRILITSSGLGLHPAPAMAPYCTSKFAMAGLAMSLRIELSRHNIQVSALCPGIIRTNIVKDSKIYMTDPERGNVKSLAVDFYERRGAPPELVAKHGLKALEKDIGIMPSPLHAWPLYLLYRLSPELYCGLVKLVWKRGWIL